MTPPPWTLPRALGALLQALVLGALLFAGVARLVAIETGARVFVYEAR